MLVNVSNHPFGKWGEEQVKAAVDLGGSISDFPFPNVPENATTEEVEEMCKSLLSSIVDLLENDTTGAEPVVHITGEFTLVFGTVTLLQQEGIKCVAATTKRVATDNADGSKTVVFNFEQFREYPVF